MLRRIMMSSVFLFSGLAMFESAFAQGADAEMEGKVRKIALAVGNAFVCMDEAGRPVMKEEIRQFYSAIVQEAGTDLGFVFASSVGYGSAQPKDKFDCEKMLKQWDGMRDDYELKAEEQ